MNFAQVFLGTWVRRKDDWYSLRQSVECVEQTLQRMGVVHVGWTVQRHERVLPGFQTVRQRQCQSAVAMTLERIDHRVADEKNTVRRASLPEQVLVGEMIS